MIRTTSASLTAKIAACIACVALVSLLSSVVAAGATTYTKESSSEYQQQLASGQIQTVTLNRSSRALRITLKDGRHVVARYAFHKKKAILAALRAKHIHVTVLTKAESLAQIASKPAHHKKRYIAAAIVIVVIVLAGAAVFFVRRRKRAME
jgi:hypothetical protein